MTTKITHCEICWVQLANSVEGYQTHLTKFHAVRSRVLRTLAPTVAVLPVAPVVIKPVRTTTRSKAHIIHEMEKCWGSALIPAVKPWQALGDC